MVADTARCRVVKKRFSSQPLVMWLTRRVCSCAQEEREWEEEVEAARRAAAESAEVRRAEAAEADLSADVAAVVDDEDLPLGVWPAPRACCCLHACAVLRACSMRILQGLLSCLGWYG